MPVFRDFLDDLKRNEELRVIDEEIDWDLQASAVCAMTQRVGGPAIQFSNVRDYPGVPLVGSVLAGPGFLEWPQQERKMQGRIAIASGLDKDTHYDEVMETLSERKKAPIRAIEVGAGPSQEVVIEAKDVDLYKYPIPRLHDKDGGRYLTSQVVLTRDAEAAWTNFGVYRLMLLGRNRLVQGTAPRLTRPRDIEKMVAKYGARGEPLPFAIVIGAPPAMTMASCLASPEGTDEYALAGGLGLTSISLVKAKLSDILVPADAEIILEGHIYPGEMAEEGPFASISYYTPKAKNFVYRVELITQRRNPVLPFVAEGARASDSMCLFSMLHSVEMLDFIRGFGVPAKWVTMPVETKLVLGVVSIMRPQPVPGLPGRAAMLIFGISPLIRQLIFVDDDVNSEDFVISVMLDKVYKAHFYRDYHISPRADKPLGLTENHDFETGLTSTAYIDATWRLDRAPETLPRRVTFEACFPEEVQDNVIRIWNEELKLTPTAWKYK
jgi:4-hydroxy-3-polyprenylbenzoate decarboxylase